MAITTTDPRTGEVLRTFDELTDEQLEDRLSRAAAAASSYRLTSFAERAGWLNAAAQILDDRVDELAALMTLEMGKTKKAAAAEVAKCASVLRYYADLSIAETAAAMGCPAGTVKSLTSLAIANPRAAGLEVTE